MTGKSIARGGVLVSTISPTTCGALAWAAEKPGHRVEAYELAVLLARLTFDRGLLRESQQRYEQAAELAGDSARQASALWYAAATAMCRFAGTDAYRLRRAAARVALEAGDKPSAPLYFAESAAVILRAPGIMSSVPSREEAEKLIAAARDWADQAQSPKRRSSWPRPLGPASTSSNRPTSRGRRTRPGWPGRWNEPLIESGALDALTGAHAGLGMVTEAARAAHRRLEVLAQLPMDVTVGYELLDALNMACEYSVGAGDLHAARAAAVRLRDLPMVVEEGHLATAQVIVVDAVAGHVTDVRVASERFREGGSEPADRGRPIWADPPPPSLWRSVSPATMTGAPTGCR